MFMTYGQSWVARQPLQLVSKEAWWLNLKALVGKLPCIMSRIKCLIFSQCLFQNPRRKKKKKKKLVFDMHFADVYGKCLNTSLVNWLYQSYRGLWMKIVRRKKKKEILQFGLNISAQRLNTWTAFKLLYFTTIQLVQAVFQRIRTQLS